MLRNLESGEAEVYFASLLQSCGIDTPDDWRERVRIGADPTKSGTARENLSIAEGPFPDVLTQGQRDLVNYAAPGLRALLGYE
jgi:hypothetical protein